MANATDPMLQQLIINAKAAVDALALYVAEAQTPAAPVKECQHATRRDLSTMGQEPWSRWECTSCGYTEGVDAENEEKDGGESS